MAKHAELSEYIDNSEKKTVIFTSYVEVLEQLQKETSEDGYNPLVVYGATNKNLGSIIQRFERDPDINPLIATFDSLSTAVPLIMANTAIMFNQPFRQHEIEQASARIDRLDQDSPVHFVNVLLDTNGVPNISTRNLDIVEWSRQQVDQIMGNSSGLDNVSVESRSSMESIDLLDRFMDTHGLSYEAIDVSFEAVKPTLAIEPTTSFYYF
jgi:superfamily II DNA or RNA helicase